MDPTRIATYPSLVDRTVLITGGATGIGASLVEHFAGQGARVGFIDIDARAGSSLAAGLAQARHAPVFVHADLTDTAALVDAVASVRRQSGPITGLVNNAANDQRHSIAATTPDSWDAGMAVNHKHQFFAAQAVIADMQGGRMRIDRQSRLGQLEAEARRDAGLHHRQGRHPGTHAQPGARPRAAQHPGQHGGPRLGDDRQADPPLARRCRPRRHRARPVHDSEGGLWSAQWGGGCVVRYGIPARASTTVGATPRGASSSACSAARPAPPRSATSTA